MDKKKFKAMWPAMTESSVSNGTGVKCKHCGKIKHELSNGHFGKCGIESVSNYLSVYPGAPIIAERYDMVKNKGKTIEEALDGVTSFEDECVTCQECGFVGKRLQTSHFKSQCSGKLKNADEYKQKYPGASIVAKTLAKRTAVTLENLIAKYGEEDGKARWDNYCKLQAETNTFDYKSKKHGMTREEFDEYNSSRAATLENMIARHGEEEGNAKWQEYCERQRYTMTLEYFIEKHGAVEGPVKWGMFDRSRLSGFGNGSSHEPDIIDEIKKFYNGEIVHQYKIPGVSYRYDIAIPAANILIECHGDYWHMNPVKYKDPSQVHTVSKRTAKEIWDLDAARKLAAEDNNYKYLVIWATDWEKHRQRMINQIKETLVGHI